MTQQKSRSRSNREKELVMLLVQANIVVRRLHELLSQTTIAEAAGVKKQTIQEKAEKIEVKHE